MEPSFWHQRWQEGRIGFHLDEVNPCLRAHAHRLGLAADGTVFVPLCGKSLDLGWLEDQGVGVLGVELSELAVRALFAARGRAARESATGRFQRFESGRLSVLCGDFFDLAPEDLAEVTAVYDRASLIALPPPLRARYVAHLRRCLPAGVPILLVTLEYPQSEMDGPPFSVHEEEVGRLLAQSHALSVLETRDVLDGEPQFRARGLTSLREKVWLITPRSAGA